MGLQSRSDVRIGTTLQEVNSNETLQQAPSEDERS